MSVSDLDFVRRYYGYVPVFQGGPRDGERCDAGWVFEYGRGCVAGYVKRPGLEHYLYVAMWANDHRMCDDGCTVRRLGLGGMA